MVAGVIVTVGFASTVTANDDVAVQPVAFVTVTLYVVVAVGATVIELVVAKLLQA